MNRAARRRAQRRQFKAVQAVKRLEKRAHGMTPMQAREELANWARQRGHSQAEIDAMNGRASMAIDVEQIFRENCGTAAKYLASEMRDRQGFKCLAIQFEMVPEGRKFDLDTVLRGDGDEALRAAVLKIADIAKNIREHIEPNEAVNGQAPGRSN